MKWFNYIFIGLLFTTFSCQKESESITLEKLSIPVSSSVYDVTFINESIGFACGGKIWTYGFVLKTIDGGSSWEVIHESDNVLYSLAVKNEQEIIAGGFSGRLWQTSDAGENWAVKEFGPDFIPLNALNWLNNGKITFSMGYKYFIGGQGFYDESTGNFTGVNKDIAMQDAYAFDDNEIIYSGYGTILKSYDSGVSYESKSTANGFFKAIDFEDEKGLVIDYNGLIQYSYNKGESWEKIDKLGNTFSQKNKLEDVEVQHNKGLICGQDGTLYKTTLGSETLVNLEHNYSDYDFYSITLTESGFAYIGSEGAIFKFVY